jgi:hypothetical protein
VTLPDGSIAPCGVFLRRCKRFDSECHVQRAESGIGGYLVAGGDHDPHGTRPQYCAHQ